MKLHLMTSLENSGNFGVRPCTLEHKISRCYKPNGFGKVKQIWLHNFSDVFQEGYGQDSYLRMVNNKDEIHCCFLMGKARVTLRKFVSIPCLELTAAVLSANFSKFKKKELQLECKHETFWTDSKKVLGYIQNNTKRFKIFVANRIYQIHKSCRVEQWRYVPSKLNLADHASHGLGIADVEGQTSTGIHGPKFLWQKEHTWPQQGRYDICEEDPEVKHSLKTILT